MKLGNHHTTGRAALHGLLLLAFIWVITSCGGSAINLKPTVSGKAGEVIVVIEKQYWDGATGKELRELLASDYPMLPQKEPSFTLINITPAAFTDIFELHRNIILIRINDTISTPTLSLKEDVWSMPQIVAVLDAGSDSLACTLLKEKGGVLFGGLDQAERNRVIRNSKKYEERSLRKLVSEEYGGSPFFPMGYSLKKKGANFIWISYETNKTTQGVFIYSIPYQSEESLSAENLINFRNEILKANVPAMLEDSYMTTSQIIEPEFRWVKYKKETFAEIRGLWETVNDFMGGPFLQHAYMNKSNNTILVMEAFVYAPSMDKRNLLRQVESILYSFEWNEKRGE